MSIISPSSFTSTVRLATLASSALISSQVKLQFEAQVQFVVLSDPPPLGGGTIGVQLR